MYKVFTVNICFSSYAMNEILVGAKDKEDLILHLKDFVEEEYIKRIKDDDWRIREVPNLFTDEPYSIIDRFMYYE